MPEGYVFKMVRGGFLENKNRDYYHFDIVDYAVFGAMLVLSALTGLYYGCRSRYCKSAGPQTLRDYLTGSGNMKPFPVAMSLIARYLNKEIFINTLFTNISF